MLKFNGKLIIFLILILTLIFNLLGCAQLKNDNSQSENSPEETVPRELIAVEDKVKDLIDKLKKIKQKKEEKEKKEESKEAQSGSQSQKSAQESGKQGTGKESEELWSKSEGSIQDLNTDWNDFEVIAQKDGVDETAIKKFEASLNLATETVKKHQINQALIKVNRLNLNLLPFLKMYKTKSPVDLKELKFYAQEIIFLEDNWEQRKQNIIQGKSLLPKLKDKIKKEESSQEKFAKLKNSILDLEEVITQKKEELVRVKGKIMLKNISDLQQK